MTDEEIIKRALQVLSYLDDCDSEDKDAIFSIANSLFHRVYLKKLYERKQGEK